MWPKQVPNKQSFNLVEAACPVTFLPELPAQKIAVLHVGQAWANTRTVSLRPSEELARVPSPAALIDPKLSLEGRLFYSYKSIVVCFLSMATSGTQFTKVSVSPIAQVNMSTRFASIFPLS